jgi:23S rRNA maturation mini-RNase III
VLGREAGKTDKLTVEKGCQTQAHEVQLKRGDRKNNERGRVSHADLTMKRKNGNRLGIISSHEVEIVRPLVLGYPTEQPSVTDLCNWPLLKLTPAGIEKRADRLVAAGFIESFLKSETGRPARIKCYRLRDSEDGFLKLSLAYLRSISTMSGDGWRYWGNSLLESAYARKYLTPDLVKRVFKENGVENPSIVKPLLSLIQVSPSALIRFLGDWKPHSPEPVEVAKDIESVEHLIFQLVFDTIGDIAVTREVPNGGEVMRASVRPEETLAQRHEPPLLELDLHGGTVFGYEAGFDTEHLFYQGEDDNPEDIFEYERNPENCWAKPWVDLAPPNWGKSGLEARIGYSFEDANLLKRLLAESATPGGWSDRPKLFKQAKWLGDAILQSYVTTELLRRLRLVEVKRLDKLRQDLVNNRFLARITKELGLRIHVKRQYWSNRSELAEVRTKMLGDSFEALIGGAYLDGGLKAAQTVTKNLMRGPIEKLVSPTRMRKNTIGID